MTTLLTASQVARVIGKSERRIQEMAAAGSIPHVPHGKRRRFLINEVLTALSSAMAPNGICYDMRGDRGKAVIGRITACRPGEQACSKCQQSFPVDHYPPSARATGRWHCRECRKQQKRESRRRDAEAAGRDFVPRDADSMAQRRAQRKADRLAQYERWLADQREAAEARRRHLQESSSLDCLGCRRTLDRSGFMPSQPRYCRECVGERDAAKFQRDKEALSDRYVKRQLTKHTGLAAHLIPQSMIEAKRVQLMLERALPTEPERYAAWLSRSLRAGPVDAWRLNQDAVAAGFNPKRIGDDASFRAARRTVAVYDADSNTWRSR